MNKLNRLKIPPTIPSGVIINKYAPSKSHVDPILSSNNEKSV